MIIEGKIKRLFIIVFLISACTVVDQVLKSVAVRLLAGRAPISMIQDLIIWEYAENSGAFLSMGSQLPAQARFILWVVLVSVLLVSAIIFMLVTADINVRQLVALSLVVGGGVGNLIDRLMNQGRVVDYVSVGIGWLRSGIFNLADLLVVGGVLILFADTLLHRPDIIESEIQ